MRQSTENRATIQIVPGRATRTTDVRGLLPMVVEGGERLLLTVPEAALRLGIGRSLMYELLASAEVESIHVGRLRRIPADALAAYVDRQRQLPGTGRR